jgi:hypothetical protein
MSTLTITKGVLFHQLSQNFDFWIGRGYPLHSSVVLILSLFFPGSHIEAQKPRVYWKPVNQIGPIPHDAICFSENKMIFSEDSILLPRTYMIARSEFPGGWDFVKSTKTLAKYVIDLGHKEYKDPNTFEVSRIFRTICFIINLLTTEDPMTHEWFFRSCVASATRSNGSGFPQGKEP